MHVEQYSLQLCYIEWDAFGARYERRCSRLCTRAMVVVIDEEVDCRLAGILTFSKTIVLGPIISNRYRVHSYSSDSVALDDYFQ